MKIHSHILLIKEILDCKAELKGNSWFAISSFFSFFLFLLCHLSFFLCPLHHTSNLDVLTPTLC